MRLPANDDIKWVRIELNDGPPSYQEGVLPLNYAPLNVAPTN